MANRLIVFGLVNVDRKNDVHKDVRRKMANRLIVFGLVNVDRKNDVHKDVRRKTANRSIVIRPVNFDNKNDVHNDVRRKMANRLIVFRPVNVDRKNDVHKDVRRKMANRSIVIRPVNFDNKNDVHNDVRRKMANRFIRFRPVNFDHKNNVKWCGTASLRLKEECEKKQEKQSARERNCKCKNVPIVGHQDCLRKRKIGATTVVGLVKATTKTAVRHMLLLTVATRVSGIIVDKWLPVIQNRTHLCHEYQEDSRWESEYSDWIQTFNDKNPVVEGVTINRQSVGKFYRRSIINKWLPVILNRTRTIKNTPDGSEKESVSSEKNWEEFSVILNRTRTIKNAPDGSEKESVSSEKDWEEFSVILNRTRLRKKFKVKKQVMFCESYKVMRFWWLQSVDNQTYQVISDDNMCYFWMCYFCVNYMHIYIISIVYSNVINASNSSHFYTHVCIRLRCCLMISKRGEWTLGVILVIYLFKKATDSGNIPATTGPVHYTVGVHCRVGGCEAGCRVSVASPLRKNGQRRNKVFNEVEKKMQITVVLGRRRIAMVEVSQKKSVGDIKLMISNKEKIPVEKQRLFYGGQLLRDDRRIEETLLKDGCTVRMLVGLKGGVTDEEILKEGIRRKRGQKAALTRLRNNVLENLEGLDIIDRRNDYEREYEKVIEIWSELQQISAKLGDKEKEEELEKDLIKVEEAFDEIEKVCKRPAARAGSVSTNTSDSEEVAGASWKRLDKLKKIEIPIFSGNVREYCKWFAAFDACVGTAKGSKEEKLLHLRQYLRGEPLRIIDDLGYSGKAYDAALAKLEKRYGGTDREYLQIMEKIEKFRMSRGDLNDIENYAELLDTLTVKFKEFKKENELYNGFLYQNLVKKLTADLAVRWTRYREDTGTEKGIGGLSEWMEREARILREAKQETFGLENATREKVPYSAMT